MTDIYWANDLSGNFTNASDWTRGVAPGVGDTAVLGAAGGSPYVVTAYSSDADVTVDIA